MFNFKTNKINKKNSFFDQYLQCISYCDIHPKGIDNDCESNCKENYLQSYLQNPKKSLNPLLDSN